MSPQADTSHQVATVAFMSARVRTTDSYSLADITTHQCNSYQLAVGGNYEHCAVGIPTVFYTPRCVARLVYTWWGSGYKLSLGEFQHSAELLATTNIPIRHLATSQ